MADDRQLMEYHVPPVGRLQCRKRQYMHITVTVVHSHSNLHRKTSRLMCLQGCQTMIAIETAKLKLGKPDRDSAYWN